MRVRIESGKERNGTEHEQRGLEIERMSRDVNDVDLDQEGS